MVRTPGFSFGGGLSPFGRRQTGFNVFDIVDQSQEAYLEFTKVNVRWQRGQATDAEYLSALKTYADSFDKDTAEYYNAQQRVVEARYNLERGKLLSQIENGTKTYDDLLAFDIAAMTGVDAGSERFRALRQNVESTTDKAAYEKFDDVRELWQAGKVTDDRYLSAFAEYANKITNPEDKESARLQLEATKYTLARNRIVTQINKGGASIGDLLAFDQQALNAGVVPGSDEYRSRLGRLQETQRAVFADQESDLQQKWQEGKLTTVQLLRWYEDNLNSPLAAGNADLIERIEGQVESLQLRLTDERDAKMVEDFNNGKLGANAFLAYAREARSRYATNTPQYRDWEQRIYDATRKTTEDNLLYRYDLTTEYADLKQFVQTNKKPPWAGGSVGEDTRWVMDENGNWKPVTTKTFTPYTPTEDQIAAWAQVRAQVQEAGKQMRYLEKQIGTVPGGWATTGQLMSYYKGTQRDYMAGSTEWYQIQERIDTIQQRISQENVWRTVGTVVQYPWTPRDPQNVGGAPGPGTGGGGNPRAPRGTRPAGAWRNPGPSEFYVSPSGRKFPGRPVPHGASEVATAPGINIDQFLWALGGYESGNSYTARNSTTGAFGRYQHISRFWPERARRYLGNSQAPMTPENQETVTRAMVTSLYNRYGDWRAVALAWHRGSVNTMNPAEWNVRNQKYVNGVMNRLGSDMWTPTRTDGVYLPKNFTSGGGTPYYQPPASPPNPRNGDNGGNWMPTPGGQPGYTPGGIPGGRGPGGGGPQNIGPGSDRSVGPQFLRRYEANGSGRIVRTGLPAWAISNPSTTGTNFESFYEAFQRAYRNGETSVTIWNAGNSVTYSLPEGPDARQDMIARLDDIRIDLYGNQAAAWGDPRLGNTDAGQQANERWDRAIKDKGENLLIGLTQPGREERVAPPQAQRAQDDEERRQGRGPVQERNYNPIADAIKFREQSQGYVDRQAEFAREFMDRGDVTGAWAAIQRAQRHVDTRARTMNDLLGQAETIISRIQSGTGASLPTDVSGDLDNLRDWDKDVDLSDLNDLMGELVGTSPRTPGHLAGTWVNGSFRPEFQPDGQLKLRPGKMRVFTDDGRVTIDDVPPPRINPLTNKPMPGDIANEFTRVTTKIGNYVTDVAVKPRITVVGQTSSGQDIYGRAFVDPQTGKWQYENPFRPGRWNSSPIIMNLPPGGRVIPDPADPSNSQKSTIVIRDDRGAYYSLRPDPNSGAYTVVLSNSQGVAVQTEDGSIKEMWRSDAADIDTFEWLRQRGFARDFSVIPVPERSFVDTPGAVSGFDEAGWRRYAASTTDWSSALTSGGTWGVPPISNIPRGLPIQPEQRAGDPIATRRTIGQVNPYVPPIKATTSAVVDYVRNLNRAVTAARVAPRPIQPPPQAKRALDKELGFDTGRSRSAVPPSRERQEQVLGRANRAMEAENQRRPAPRPKPIPRPRPRPIAPPPTNKINTLTRGGIF